MPQASTPKGKQEFDVFLCHNSKDKPEVKRIAEPLKAQGIVPWLDEWELRPGLPWQRALEEQIEHIKLVEIIIAGFENYRPITIYLAFHSIIDKERRNLCVRI